MWSILSYLTQSLCWTHDLVVEFLRDSALKTTEPQRDRLVADGNRGKRHLQERGNLPSYDLLEENSPTLECSSSATEMLTND